MRTLNWEEAQTKRRLWALSAALALSTSLTAPVLAADQTITGTQVGPITVNAPIDTLASSATITANTGAGALILGGNPAHFKQVTNTGTITATGASTDGINAGVAIESFLNSGSIASDDLGIYYGGLFSGSAMTNAAGALIEGDNAAVEIYYGLNSFENAGTLRSTDGNAFRVKDTAPSGYGYVGTFTNAATGEIYGGDTVVLLKGGVGTFNNHGLIETTGGGAGIYAPSATAFTNYAGGTVRSTLGTAIVFERPALADPTSVGMFLNDGLVQGGAGGVAFTGVNVNSFANGASGKIYGAGSDAVLFDGNVATFSNGGWIEATGHDGVAITGTAGTFTNRAGATIKSATGKAVDFDGAVTTFVNDGTIASGYKGIDLDSPTGSFTNTGTITAGTGHAIDGSSYHIDSFVNSGTITSSNYYAIHAGSFGSFSNTGTIRAGSGRGVEAFSDRTETFVNSGSIFATDIAVDLGAVGSFTNTATGVIESSNYYGVWLSNKTDGFVNRGRIATTGGTGPAVHLNDTVGSFINSGTINSFGDTGLTVVRTGTGPFVNEAGGTIRGEDYGALFYFGATAFENRGLVTGWVGMGFSDNSTYAAKVINSGTIEGVSGTAIDFGADNFYNYAHDDTLELRTGSRILGSVKFAGGSDTLDVSGFKGSTILTVADLETVLTGDRLVNQQLTSGTGTISIIDGTGITGGGTTVMREVAGAIGREITGALGARTGGAASVEPMGYAPARPVGAAEAATGELVAASAPEVWGKVFGSVANSTNDYSNVLGGIVAGSHTAIDANTRLGGVVSVSGSRFTTVGGQTIASGIGAAGLYGSTDLGDVTLSYSVLGGVAANHSDRTVTTMVTETASADYASWFLSPELGLSIPVPLLDGIETATGFKLRYVGGEVGSYTETGSSQNLSVGTAAVNLLDARMELTATTQVASNDYGEATLSTTAGLLAQQNFGASVAIAGFPFATTPDSFAYGAYGDITLDSPIGPAARASASAGLELRSDGVTSASANLGMSAAF
ncbi:autotransporter outer membrane beta-barrel domain-containing protein [Devosia sp. LjRoot16]|uniref:beta strand repeat-containing protein n=1 Tax=Devosia sp. LjRoot16 TaxID=3342271 RepID=UPI003ECF3AFB